MSEGVSDFVKMVVLPIIGIAVFMLAAAWLLVVWSNHSVSDLPMTGSGEWVRTTGEDESVMMRYTDRETGVVCYRLLSTPDSLQCVKP